MKIAVIGGSNSCLRPGYVSQLPLVLAEMGLRASILDLATGGNTSVKGLIEVAESDLSEADICIIEYSINDMSLIDQVGIEVWETVYEGLIRRTMRTAPRAAVIPLFLARSDACAQPRIAEMRERLTRLCALYGLAMADFDRYLRGLVPDPAQFDALYQDPAHYRRPDTTAILAGFVAIAVQSALVARAAGLPLTDVAHPLDHARVADIPALGGMSFGRETFHNSRYNLTALRLPEGETLELRPGGKLLALGYVSSADSCDLVVEQEAGRPVRLFTRHPQVVSGEFGFLVRTTPLIATDFAAPYDGPIRLTALSTAAAEVRFGNGPHLLEPPLEPSPATGGGAVHLIQALLA